MKTEYKPLTLALTASLCFWILDALLGLHFHEGTFLDQLILKVSTDHLLLRLLVILLAVVFGCLGTADDTRRTYVS